MREMRLVSEAGLYALMTDVCRVLELYDISKAVSRLDDDEKRKIIESRVVVDPRLNLGSDSREINIINESGLYALMTDVCRVLELDDVSKAVSRLDDDEKMTLDLTEGHSGQRGGAQFKFINIINESGLYALIFTSRKTECGNFCKKKKPYSRARLRVDNLARLW